MWLLGVRVSDAGVVDLVDRLHRADLELTAATLRSALDESAHHVSLEAHDREALLYVLEHPAAPTSDPASGLRRLNEILRTVVALDERERFRSAN
jgi:hypothetical protein